MTRTELYRAMEHEKIIMYDEFLARLNRTPLLELVTRWAGVLELAKEHEITRKRADWLAMFMWNSTALTVGENELVRKTEERKRAAAKREEQERKRREQEIHGQLAEKKLQNWNAMSSANRKRLVEEYLPKADGFFRGYVLENYFNDLDSMTDRDVVLWFWNIIPPFSPEVKSEAFPMTEAA